MGKKKIIHVFEHQKLPIGGDFKLRHWQALAKRNEKEKIKFLELQHNGIKLKQFVGVIQVADLTIEILPKIDSTMADHTKEEDRWQKVLIEMYRHTRSVKLSTDQRAWLAREKGDLLTIYIRLFLNDVEKLVREGMIKGYQCKKLNAQALRGAIDFPRHIEKNLASPGNIYVESTVYSKDILCNQLILAALDIIPTVCSDSDLLLKHKQLTQAFAGVKRVSVNPNLFSRVMRNRKTVQYQPALLMAEMLLKQYRPSNRGGNDHVLSILFDMNTLWQDYIFHRLREASGETVTATKNLSQHFWRGPENDSPRKIRPDIVLQWENRTVVIDTKWKLPKNFKPSDADLKQIFVYNLYWEAIHGILLYPAQDPQENVGAYADFKSMPYAIHCGVLTCNILGADHLLDPNLGHQILEKLKDMIQ